MIVDLALCFGLCQTPAPPPKLVEPAKPCEKQSKCKDSKQRCQRHRGHRHGCKDVCKTVTRHRCR